MTRLLTVLACLAALLASCVVLGPGADDDDQDTEEDSGSFGSGPIFVAPPGAGSAAPANVTGWSCYESARECSCNKYSSSSVDGRCRYAWNCCVHTPSSNTCRCYTDDSCAAVVASMQGAELVQTCPPNAASVPEACAEADENCTRDYLDEQGVHGCCAGLVCKANAQNVRVCQPASEAEQAAAALCMDDRAEGLIVAGPLPSSGGDLPFTVAGSLLPEIGASGCPAYFPLSLSTGGDITSSFLCSLNMMAGPDRDAEGRLVVHNLQLAAEGLGATCAGFPEGVRGRYMEGGATAGTLEFDGASCEAGPSKVCIAGRMLLTLDATLTGTSGAAPGVASGPVSLTFAGASVELNGRICDNTPAATACPAQP